MGQDPADSADATLPAGADSLAGVGPVTVRAGQADDYAELQPIDPQHFVVGKEIARGGMGRILAARDRRLGRPVAIKELLHSSDDLRARFEREARITAKLQHPAIVNILEAGEWPGGEPFYVMKLVTGESFDRVIARSTTLEQRLGLLPTVIAVVDALAYAHSKQVIHRDLKPQNVLVGEFGETVVIDWGLAKELSERDVSGVRTPRSPGEDATIVGSVMGTPAYMPLEQARGDAVDARADVYSLGAILYHVLVGVPPYTGSSTDDTLDRVLQNAPRSIASQTEGVPRDLVTIIEKAMARDVADRYPTAAELAADLKKFQTGQLVGAHEYSAWQLVRRWARVHRTALGVAAVSFVVLAVLGGLGLRRIFAEQRESERLGKIAERRRGQAEELLSFMLGDLRAKLSPLGKLDVLKDVAIKATAYFDEKGEALSDDDLAKRAKAQRQLGEVLLEQGDTAGARRVQEEAMSISKALAGNTPASLERQFDLAAGHHEMGAIASATGDSKAALAEYRTEQSILETLTRSDPGNADWQRNLSLSQKSIGSALIALGDTSGALSAFRDALAVHIMLLTKEPGNPEHLWNQADIRLKLGETLFSTGDVAEALVEYRAALAMAEQLVAKDPKNVDRQTLLARSHQRVARALDTMEGTGGSLAESRAALSIYERLADNDPSDALKQVDVGTTYMEIGEILRLQGDVDGATAAFRKAVAISAALAARDPSNADRASTEGLDQRRLGADLLERGDTKGALDAYARASSIARGVVAQDPENIEKRRAVGQARDGLGDVYLAGGDVKRALTEYQAAIEIALVIVAKDPSHAGKQRDVGLLRMKIAEAEIAQGAFERGLAESREARVVFEALVQREPSNATARNDLAFTLRTIGNALLQQEKPTEALVELRAAADLFTSLVTTAPDNVDYLIFLGYAHATIGEALLVRGDRTGALAAYKLAHAVMQKAIAKAPNRTDIVDDAAKFARKAGAR